MPQRETIEKLAGALGLDPNWLAGIRREPPPMQMFGNVASVPVIDYRVAASRDAWQAVSRPPALNVPSRVTDLQSERSRWSGPISKLARQPY